MSKGITAKERKNLLGADQFARLLHRPLNTTLDFHPCHLADCPAKDLDTFFSELRMRISTRLRRWGIGTYWVWTRENYEGERREHLHMVLHLPPRYRAELEAYIRRQSRYKGNAFVVEVGERKNEFNPVTRRWEDGLRYRMKQLRGDAVGAPGPTRLNRETKSRYDGAPVAPVYGQRCGVSDSLSLKAEQAWRAARHEHVASSPAEDRFASLKRRGEFQPSEPQILVGQGTAPDLIIRGNSEIQKIASATKIVGSGERSAQRL
jgi:hypothetical protein